MSSLSLSMFRVRTLVVGLLSVLSGTQAHAQAANRATMIRRLDSIAAAPVKSGAVAGVSVAVVKGRDTLLYKGYGFADIENQLPATPQSVFRIGSLTKQFTSAVIMQLVEQGKLSLDDNINTYIPNFPTHGRTILVRHLLNHTSGIPSYTDVGNEFGKMMRNDLTPDQLLAVIAPDSLQFEPGTHMYYNNTGYYMLGLIIEKVTGKKYGEYLESTLFKTAGLPNTIYCDTRRLIPRRAQGYDKIPSGLVNAQFLSMQLPYAAGSLCSTVGDLVSWTHQLSSGRVVSAASYRAMTTPVTLPSGRPMTYGYGLGADTLAGRRVISHGGGINGFISYLIGVPQDSIVIAVLSNTSPAPSQALANAMLRVVLGVPDAPPPAPVKDLATTAAERARYVGEYLLAQPDGRRVPVTVTERGETLIVQSALDPRPQTLRSQGDHVFVSSDNDRLAFDVNGNRATGFVMGPKGGSRTFEAVRVK